MTGSLPDYYFRVRENGALVFRIESNPRQRRFEMLQIASVNIRNGEVKPHGDTTLSEADLAEIDRWITTRSQLLARRDFEEVLRTAESLNLTTQWAQSRATPQQLQAVSETLLLAMHDLRQVLIRKRVERLTKPS